LKSARKEAQIVVSLLVFLLLFTALPIAPVKGTFSMVWEKWALIIAGSGSPQEEQFLRDAAYMWNTLWQYYGFSPDNLRFLYVTESAPNPVPQEYYGGAATLANVRDSITNWLGSRSDPDDTVFIYIATHGVGACCDGTLMGGRKDLSGDEGDEYGGFGVDEALYLEADDSYYWDDDLREDLQSVFYSDLVIVVQACVNVESNMTCFSGGLIDDLSAPHRVIITASNETSYSYKDCDGDAFSEFSEGFIDALRWNDGEWAGNLIIDGEPVDADVDNNGHVSIQEAWDYAYSHDDARKTVRTKSGTVPDPFPPELQCVDESPWIDTDGDGLPTFINGADVLDTSQKKAIVYLDWLMGDLNHDGIVNFIDLFLFRKIYCYSYNSIADFDCDGDVDFADLYIFKQQYQKYACVQEV